MTSNKPYKTSTIYHFGGGASDYIYILSQYFFLVVLIVIKTNEIESYADITWNGLSSFLFYTFFVIVMIDSMLFRMFLRFILSIAFGVMGYFYAIDFYSNNLGYIVGVFVGIIFLVINFIGVKSLYDV